MRKILNVKSWLIFGLLLPSLSLFAQSSSSVLASGEWFKLKVANTGVYKISYEYLKSIGYPMAGLKSDQIKLYGNSTGMLPFENSVFRPDDLLENALMVFDGGDGDFNSGDYLLFYAKGPDTWKYNPSRQAFIHTKHCYDDFSYFFLTKNDKTPLRSAVMPQPSGTEVAVINKFTDFQFHEKDLENLAKSGRRLYGEKFDFVTEYSFGFNFPDIISSIPAKVRVTAAMRSLNGEAYLKIASSGSNIGTMKYLKVGGQYSIANTGDAIFDIVNPGTSPRIDVTLDRAGRDATAWLNFIEVNAIRALNFSGNAIYFRSVEYLKSSEIVKFTISNANSDVLVYDVTDPVNPKRIEAALNGSNLEFKATTDVIHEYMAISGSNFSAPTSMGKIANQDLHSLSNVDMVIISHPDFMSQAARLQQLHESEGLSVVLLNPSVVYNEFASGAKDITAIKDLMRMLYKKANGNVSEQPKYLLLFGDGSYMNKDYTGNTNFLPTYQSEDSEDLVDSFVSDDYFGFLDDNEGESPANKVDIGIGRFPVSNQTQAAEMVDKIFHYVSTGYTPGERSPFGDWRNKVLFIADDLSGNPGSNNELTHVDGANQCANKVDNLYKPYLTDKIYLDAYKQISTPGGERYPDAATAFRNKVQQGALIVNYTGHGGEVGLAHERVLDMQTIGEWTNYDALPLFVTATCEFARFDDPARTSAGELVFLNPKGGGIGLLTTTRLVYSAPNDILNQAFYDYALPDSTGLSRTLGEITMLTKQKAAEESPSFQNHMNFMLIGDPALRLAYPKFRVHTDSINGIDGTQFADTVKAFGRIKLSGSVTDLNNSVLGDFNGVVDVTVLDKPETLTTLGNDNSGPAYRYSFKLKDKIIYKGKATVKNGLFTVEFIVPKDISFAYGKGSIVYYANNGTIDANGGYDEILVGGVSSNPVVDDKGPGISLFLNTTDFNPGDITDENPMLLAFITDESGINTTGNGIGHEILATLDENTEDAIVLNNYYVADLDTYKEGRVEYPYRKLANGAHTLTIKVWDINNNSATARTNFVVASADGLTIENLMNYPNPVVDETRFSFDHNQAGKDLSVKVEIYDQLGKLVKRIEVDVNEPGYQSKSIKWDGTSDGGYTIPGGLYVYRLTVKKEDGTEASQTNRLLLVK